MISSQIGPKILVLQAFNHAIAAQKIQVFYTSIYNKRNSKSLPTKRLLFLCNQMAHMMHDGK